MRRGHPIHRQIRAADIELGESDWMTRFRFGLYTDAADLAAGPKTNLYVVYDLAFDAFKFGIAVDPKDRLANLQIGNPRPLMLVTHCPATKELERYFHGQLKQWALQGEWFRSSPQVLAAAGLIEAAEDLAEDMARCDDEPSDAALSIQHVCWDFFEAEYQLRRAA